MVSETSQAETEAQSRYVEESPVRILARSVRLPHLPGRVPGPERKVAERTHSGPLDPLLPRLGHGRGRTVPPGRDKLRGPPVLEVTEAVQGLGGPAPEVGPIGVWQQFETEWTIRPLRSDVGGTYERRLRCHR
jgi:hypothetical protein